MRSNRNSILRCAVGEGKSGSQREKRFEGRQEEGNRQRLQTDLRR
jgi:hypothetical protein